MRSNIGTKVSNCDRCRERKRDTRPLDAVVFAARIEQRGGIALEVHLFLCRELTIPPMEQSKRHSRLNLRSEPAGIRNEFRPGAGLADQAPASSEVVKTRHNLPSAFTMQ
jgi:hypothetical protein